MHPAKKTQAFDAPTPLPLSSKMQQTLASLRLEGLTPDEASMHDIQLFDAGEIKKEEFLKRALARAKA
ncbi:MAG: antitoxin VbhA family protein [Legionellales bacterium]|nr:antitoxin VbhA family protein [Legionellales bacterium]